MRTDSIRSTVLLPAWRAAQVLESMTPGHPDIALMREHPDTPVCISGSVRDHYVKMVSGADLRDPVSRPKNGGGFEFL